MFALIKSSFKLKFESSERRKVDIIIIKLSNDKKELSNIINNLFREFVKRDIERFHKIKDDENNEFGYDEHGEFGYSDTGLYIENDKDGFASIDIDKFLKDRVLVLFENENVVCDDYIDEIEIYKIVEIS